MIEDQALNSTAIQKVQELVKFKFNLEEKNPGLLQWFMEQPEYEAIKVLENTVDQISSMSQLNAIVVDYRDKWIRAMIKYKKVQS